MSNKVSNPVAEEYNNTLEELRQASQLIRNAGAQVYGAPPSDNDTNLFARLKDAISKIAVEKADNFEKLIKAHEPNIENLNDLAQKLVISNILIQYLYAIKSNRPDVDVLPVIMLIPYWADNETWLKCLEQETLAYLVNLELI